MLTGTTTFVHNCRSRVPTQGSLQLLLLSWADPKTLGDSKNWLESTEGSLTTGTVPSLRPHPPLAALRGPQL